MTHLHVNNVLCYISSARETLNATDIINIASAFYDTGLFCEAKDFRYGLIDVRVVRRKTPDAKKKELKDHLDGFDTAEQKEITLPTFDEITILDGKTNSADSLTRKQVLNEMAEMKKKVEKIEKRSQTQQPVDQPRNGSRTERTAVTPRYNEVVKNPQGMTMQEVVTGQAAELARIRAEVDNEAKRGQVSNDVRNHGSRRDDQSGPHDNRNHEFEWQVAGANFRSALHTRSANSDLRGNMRRRKF